MSQERLNHLLVLHTHKDNTDSLELIVVANTFVSFSEHRIQIFGNFTEDDNISCGYCCKCKNSLQYSQCCQ